MSRRWKRIAGACVLVFAAAQLIRPERANAPTDASRAIQAEAGWANGLVAVLDRACRESHSNGTMWAWYTQIAPASWLMARGVADGRKAVNFSEWASYQPEVQRTLLAASCKDVSTGKMLGPRAAFRDAAALAFGGDVRVFIQSKQKICTRMNC